MCGLAGFIESRGGSGRPELEALVGRMADALQHRGPDDKGVWVDAEAGIALGFRRLSILDLSPAGHQPMSSLCGRFVIVYNGKTILDGHDSKHASGKIGLQWATHAVTGKGIEFRNIKVKRLS